MRLIPEWLSFFGEDSKVGWALLDAAGYMGFFFSEYSLSDMDYSLELDLACRELFRGNCDRIDVENGGATIRFTFDFATVTITDLDDVTEIRAYDRSPLEDGAILNVSRKFRKMRPNYWFFWMALKAMLDQKKRQKKQANEYARSLARSLAKPDANAGSFARTLRMNRAACQKAQKTLKESPDE
jgi:hypothetical protein